MGHAGSLSTEKYHLDKSDHSDFFFLYKTGIFFFFLLQLLTQLKLHIVINSVYAVISDGLDII